MADNAMKSSIPAILLLGVIGGIETAAPNISSSALVSVSRDLHMSTAELALAASAQTILIAATVITTGMLADRLGRRLVLSIGLLVGAAGSAVCAFAPSPAVYVAGQAIVGIGLGAAVGDGLGAGEDGGEVAEVGLAGEHNRHRRLPVAMGLDIGGVVGERAKWGPAQRRVEFGQPGEGRGDRMPFAPDDGHAQAGEDAAHVGRGVDGDAGLGRGLDLAVAAQRDAEGVVE